MVDGGAPVLFHLFSVYFGCLCLVYSLCASFNIFNCNSYPRVIVSHVTSSGFFRRFTVFEVIFPLKHGFHIAAFFVRLSSLCVAILVESLHFSFRCVSTQQEVLNVSICFFSLAGTSLNVFNPLLLSFINSADIISSIAFNRDIAHVRHMCCLHLLDHLTNHVASFVVCQFSSVPAAFFVILYVLSV